MTRRNSIIICSLLAFGIAVLVLAGLVAEGDNNDIVLNSNPGVLELIPNRGDEVIAQTNIGVVFSPSSFSSLRAADVVASYLERFPYLSVRPLCFFIVFCFLFISGFGWGGPPIRTYVFLAPHPPPGVSRPERGSVWAHRVVPGLAV